MSEERLLTIRDVSLALGISEKEVIELSEAGQIPAYKVGGVYLRFKQEQIEEFRKVFKSLKRKAPDVHEQHTFKDKLADFLYFNDFYILAALLALLMLFIILKMR